MRSHAPLNCLSLFLPTDVQMHFSLYLSSKMAMFCWLSQSLLYLCLKDRCRFEGARPILWNHAAGWNRNGHSRSACDLPLGRLRKKQRLEDEVLQYRQRPNHWDINNAFSVLQLHLHNFIPQCCLSLKSDWAEGVD